MSDAPKKAVPVPGILVPAVIGAVISSDSRLRGAVIGASLGFVSSLLINIAVTPKPKADNSP